MSKCSGCGKFVTSSTNSSTLIGCAKCKGLYHKLCVNLSKSTHTPKHWMGPCCAKKIPRGDNTDTPVKSLFSDNDTPPTSEIEDSEYRQSCGGTSSAPVVAAGGPLPSASDAQMARDLVNSSPMASPIATSLSSPSCHCSELVTEIREFRKEMVMCRTTMAALREQLADTRADVGLCKKQLNAVSEEFQKMSKRVDDLENKNRDDERVSQLEDALNTIKLELNDKEQELLSNDVEITGIPEADGENTLHLVKLVAAKICVPLEEADIVTVYRSGPRHAVATNGAPSEDGKRVRPRPIVVRCARRAQRDCLLREARVRRSLTTAGLQAPGPDKPVYINERLTKDNRRLFSKSKEEARRNSWRYIWTNNGKIFVRQRDGMRAFRIKQLSDLARVFNSVETATVQS